MHLRMARPWTDEPRVQQQRKIYTQQPQQQQQQLEPQPAACVDEAAGHAPSRGQPQLPIDSCSNIGRLHILLLHIPVTSHTYGATSIQWCPCPCVSAAAADAQQLPPALRAAWRGICQHAGGLLPGDKGLSAGGCSCCNRCAWVKGVLGHSGFAGS